MLSLQGNTAPYLHHLIEAKKLAFEDRARFYADPDFAEGIVIDAMRARSFPFGEAFRDFVDAHDRIFVIEQNRDAQFRSLMMIELGVDASKLISVLNYDGMPITADNIFRQIKNSIR